MTTEQVSYKNAKGAREAARKVLGKAAVQDEEFALSQTDDDHWVWDEIKPELWPDKKLEPDMKIADTKSKDTIEIEIEPKDLIGHIDIAENTPIKSINVSVHVEHEPKKEEEVPEVEELPKVVIADKVVTDWAAAQKVFKSKLYKKDL